MRGAKCRSKMRILLGLRPNSGSGNRANATCASAQRQRHLEGERKCE